MPIGDRAPAAKAGQDVWPTEAGAPWDESQMSDATRDDVVQAIRERVDQLGWRVREGDRFFVMLLPPLARSTPGRDRWPDEPHEGHEDHEHW